MLVCWYVCRYVGRYVYIPACMHVYLTSRQIYMHKGLGVFMRAKKVWPEPLNPSEVGFRSMRFRV